MPLNTPYVGEQYSPAYQVSALPYLTSSTISKGQIHEYNFPYVTRFINLVNRGSGSIALGFTERGLRPEVGNYITLSSCDSLGEEIRTTRLFLSCSDGSSVKYELFCGLTTISPSNFLMITGSNGHQGVG